MGYYYSGGLDWTLNKEPIYETCSLIGSAPQSEEYGKYVDAHFKELIDKYGASILWNDIAYPVKGKLMELISYYYNTIEDGVVNDRWTQIPTPARYLKKSMMKYFINKIAERMVRKGGFEGRPPKGVGDFSTPEYSPRTNFHSYKWEACRGIGRSFGYNQMEKDEHYIGVHDLIFSFVDIVSKNGNLLLNIGPDKYGEIPELQMKRLDALGKWLEINGEGIYETNAWSVQALNVGADIQIRFTQKSDKNQIFCFIDGIKDQRDVLIKGSGINSTSIKEISMLGTNENVQFSSDHAIFTITLPNSENSESIIGLKIQF
jgi:alpha-L-fucosidase